MFNPHVDSLRSRHSKSELPASTMALQAGKPLTSARIGVAVALALLLAFVGMADAQNLLGGANDSTLTSYTGIIVKQANGSLSALPVQAGFHLPNNNGSLVSQTFRMGFRLVDGVGTTVNEVFTGTFGFGLFGHSSGSGTQTATLTPPPNSLAANTVYQVSAQLYRQTTPGNFTAVGFAALSDSYRFRIVDVGSAAGVVGFLTSDSVTQPYAVATIAGGDSFQVQVGGTLGRLDQLALAVASDNYNIYLDASITGDVSGPIALVNARTTLAAALANHSAAGGPSAVAINQTLALQPTAQLDSTDSYSITVMLSYAGPDAVETLADTATLRSQRLLYFNGTLLFGSTVTQISAIANAPEPLGTVAGVGENSTLGIPPGGAALASNPTYTFGTGDNLGVLLHLDGTAEVTAGSVVLAAPTTPDSGTVNGVAFSRNNVVLDATGGLTAAVAVQFPAGFGVGIGRNTRRLLGSFPAGTLALNGALSVTGLVSLSPSSVNADAFYAVHDELPEMFQSSGIDWDIAAGTFTVHRLNTFHVRAAEMSMLNDPALRASLSDPSAADRPSNDGYLLNPAADAGWDVVISTDPQGRAVIASAQIDLPPSNYTAHFPLGTNVAWTQAGIVVIQGGLIDTTQSSLPGATDASFTTSPGAPTSPQPAGTDTFTFSPGAAAWSFTPDGGLHAEGLIVPAPLRWGARDATHFANLTDNFPAASAHLPGHIMRGVLATTSSDNRAGEVLYSGWEQPGNASYSERPGNAASYALGLADYAGLNLRVAADGAQNATSLIGDASVGPYPLRATSKYYVRPAGISGIHEAVTSAFASQAGSLVLHGFPLALTNFQLSFLDNTMHDSLVGGVVTVPAPRPTLAGLAQPFSQLKLTSKGEPSEVVLPEPNNFEHTLTYWNAKFHPLTVEFQQHPTNANLFALVIGAEVMLEGVVKDPIRGALGFFPGGRMVAASDGFPGVTSRLKPPKLIGLHGTGSFLDASRPAFSVHPVSDVYFNDPSAGGAPDTGFVSFAGTVAVPFFEDLKVHVLARANGSQTTVRRGWSDASGDFFSNAKFDPSNRGFPPVGLAAYENPADPGDLYNPHAKQSWMGFVDFDMPIVWDSALRQFASSVPETRDFLVLNSERVITQLAPSGAAIRFGLQFNGLPRMDLTSLVIDEDEATNKVIDLIPNGPQLVAALKAFDMLLNGKSDQLISDAADTAVGAIIDQMFAGLPANASAQNVRDQIATFSSQLSTALGNIVGASPQDANTLLKTIADSLADVDDGLTTADALLAVNPTTHNFQIFDTIKAIGKSLGSVAPEESQAFDDAVDGLVGEVTPTLLQIKNAVDQLHSDVSAARDAVVTLQSLLQVALDATNGQIVSDTLARMQEVIPSNDPTGHYFGEIDPATLKAQLKLAARDVLNESGFITNLQSTVRDLVEPLHEEYRGAFDQIHAVINDGVRSAFSKLGNEVASHINENLANANRAIGAFNDTFRLSKTEGSATIIGNVLDNAHINAALSLHVPDPVTLTGSVDFQHLRGDQPVPGVAGAGADGRMQVTLKAEGNASIAGCPPVDAKAMGQYTMNSSGQPLGVSGSLSVDSDIHFDILALRHAEFDFAFGALDNYLYAEASGSILIFDAQVKGFIGRTTQDSIVRKVDPLLDQVLAKLSLPAVDINHPITGYYFNAVGDVVLNRLFGIPDDVITLKGRGGQGRFAFCDDSLTHVIPGMRWDSGLSVGLGPVTASAELVALGGLDPLPLLQSDNVADIAKTLFTPPVGIHGAIAAKFTASAGPFSQDFHFTATGKYTPPPFAPPPGIFFVNSLDF